MQTNIEQKEECKQMQINYNRKQYELEIKRSNKHTVIRQVNTRTIQSAIIIISGNQNLSEKLMMLHVNGQLRRPSEDWPNIQLSKISTNFSFLRHITNICTSIKIHKTEETFISLNILYLSVN